MSQWLIIARLLLGGTLRSFVRLKFISLFDVDRVLLIAIKNKLLAFVENLAESCVDSPPGGPWVLHFQDQRVWAFAQVRVLDFLSLLDYHLKIILLIFHFFIKITSWREQSLWQKLVFKAGLAPSILLLLAFQAIRSVLGGVRQGVVFWIPVDEDFVFVYCLVQRRWLVLGQPLPAYL